MYDQHFELKKLIFRKQLNISLVLIQNKTYSYFQLIFPFDFEKMIFCDDFIYLTAGSYHHVISSLPTISQWDNENIIIWIYFKTNLNINETNIHFIPHEATIYVIDQNCVYKYCHKVHDIKKFVSDNDKILIVPAYNNHLNNDSKILYCIQKDGIYSDNGKLEKRSPYNEYLPYIVNLHLYLPNSIVLIDIDNSTEIIKNVSPLYFNIHRLKYYKLVNTGIIYYDDSNTLCYCTSNVLNKFPNDSTLIEKIVISDNTYYIYMFNDLPNTITDIQFTNNLILIQSGNKYFYHAVDTNNFKIKKFEEIAIRNNYEEKLVRKDQIVRKKPFFEETIVLTINICSNKLKKLLDITEMIGKNTNFHIQFLEGTYIITRGNGPKKELIDTALIIFSEEYLIKYNTCCELNIIKIKQLTDDELMNIGAMLHLIIRHTNNHLSIRLPLPLISNILNKVPTIVELEYFAKLENPQVFNNVYKYKTEPEMIQSFGYETYEKCINMLCKYYHDSELNNLTLREINTKIASGFRKYDEIKNIKKMNCPTFDYFLSGDYNLDRVLLIKNLQINSEPSNDNDKYETMITEMLISLPENKLAILLKNWTGTSIIERGNKYKISIVKRNKMDVYFSACNSQIIISKRFIDSDTMFVDILTTPVSTMIDL